MKVTINRKEHKAVIELTVPEINTLLDILPSQFSRELPPNKLSLVKALRQPLVAYCDDCGNFGAECICEWMDDD